MIINTDKIRRLILEIVNNDYMTTDHQNRAHCIYCFTYDNKLHDFQRHSSDCVYILAQEILKEMDS